MGSSNEVRPVIAAHHAWIDEQLQVGDPNYRTINGILAAGTEHDGLTTHTGSGAGSGVPARTRCLRHRTQP